ncbi:DUF3347 domain-containing protein [Flavobacterium jejuense]|uniref:DUF3347 domain-containing protein n=1 Tax=Flavobacterium jejuense TaxID=1544455 RepID=A0ABX0IQA3_9FLAO|nr:DUF3347 domain-containing protein [Flavobacterium jejuense]NHN24658.1 DUF3347 domain-containing protein [Flavobacterium jejuense]
MKSINNILMLTVMFASFTLSNAQIKNQKIVSEKILGNCGICKKTIEKAGNMKNIATVEWDKETKMATISYDAKKTNKEEVLKRIALAGYDSNSFLAPDVAYFGLPNCCQYERVSKTAISEKPKMEMKAMMKEKIKSSENTKPLSNVYSNYFELKDALVASDSKSTAVKANDLLAAVEKVDMKTLDMDLHMVWMKILKPLKEEVKAITTSKNREDQRFQFVDLSENMFKLMKSDKLETTIYLQHCPMANDGKGANWLSKESIIKNPYYGSMMLSCGKTIETIKN